MGDKRLHLLVKGMVQGVFFRTSVRDIAANLLLNGWVKNLPDGNVEIMAEGAEQDLQDLLKWAKKGPENAVVESVEEEWSDSQDAFEDFEIIEESLKAHDTKAAALKRVEKILDQDEDDDHPVHENYTKEDKPFKQ